MNSTLHVLDYMEALLRELISWRKNQHISFRVVVFQILFTGYEALLPVFISSLSLGMLLAYLGQTYLKDIGQIHIIYDLLIMGTIRDVGPFVLCLIILLRSGTAITSELGCMRLSREIDALEIMGISSISYLVVPRVLGMVFSLLILSAYSIFAGLLGSYVTLWMLAQIPYNEFFLNFTNHLSAPDIYIPLIKLVLTGLIIGGLCSYHGLQVARAQTEIPQRLIKAVTQCILVILFLHGLIITLTEGLASS